MASSNVQHSVQDGVQVRAQDVPPSQQGFVREDTPVLVELDASRVHEVCILEQRCYPNPWSSQLIEIEFTKEISYRLGILIGGKVAAYSFSYLIPQDLHLLNIAVAPEFRGRGYGRFLLSTILTRSVGQGVTCVSLEVRPSNTIARDLYRSFGFRQIAVRKNYYRDNSEDALLLQLILPEVPAQPQTTLNCAQEKS